MGIRVMVFVMVLMVNPYAIAGLMSCLVVGSAVPLSCKAVRPSLSQPASQSVSQPVTHLAAAAAAAAADERMLGGVQVVCA